METLSWVYLPIKWEIMDDSCIRKGIVRKKNIFFAKS